MSIVCPGVLNHIAFLLNVATVRAYQHIAHLLVEFELNINEYFMLLLLEKDGEELSQKGIAETLCVNVNTVTRLLDNLETLGLAKRVSNPDNRKENIPVITPKGSKVASRAGIKVVGNKRDAYSAITEREQVELERILLKLNAAKGPGAG